MKILGLPGRDQATVAWLEQLLSAIGEGDHHVTLPEYRHWNTSQPPDPQYEADQLNLTGSDLGGEVHGHNSAPGVVSENPAAEGSGADRCATGRLQ